MGKSFFSVLIALVFSIFFTACGGSGGGSENFVRYDPNVLYTGTFVDSPVKGLRYKTQTQNGFTDEKGSFQYKENEFISFYIGNLFLGRVSARKLITPYTLGGGSPTSPSDRAVNIAVLLQNCDKHSSSSYIDVTDYNQSHFPNTINLNDSTTDFINAMRNESIPVNIDKTTALQHLNDALGYNSSNSFTIPTISAVQKKEFLDAINAARAQQQDCGEYGIKPAVGALTWNDKLYKAAYTYNYDMVHGNAWHHVGSNTDSDIVAKIQHLDRGSYMRDRIEYYNYVFSLIGENIAKGYQSVDDVVAGWIDSDGHCKNLMNPEFMEIGMSLLESSDRYHKYWTQDFGKSR